MSKKVMKKNRPVLPVESDESRQIYEPPEWAWKYVSACLDWTIKQTKTARCEAIDIHRDTLWTAEKDPQFQAWVNERVERMLAATITEVQGALVRMCLDKDLGAIKLYLEHYGSFVPTTKTILETEGDLSGLSNAKLARIAAVIADGDGDVVGGKVH